MTVWKIHHNLEYITNGCAFACFSFFFFSLCLSVEEVHTKAKKLRAQYSRMLKPKPTSGSGSKPLTYKQKWLTRVMDFMKQHIVHRAPKTTVSHKSINLTSLGCLIPGLFSFKFLLYTISWFKSGFILLFYCEQESNKIILAALESSSLRNLSMSDTIFKFTCLHVIEIHC